MGLPLSFPTAVASYHPSGLPLVPISDPRSSPDPRSLYSLHMMYSEQQHTVAFDYNEGFQTDCCMTDAPASPLALTPQQQQQQTSPPVKAVLAEPTQQQQQQASISQDPEIPVLRQTSPSAAKDPAVLSMQQQQLQQHVLDATPRDPAAAAAVVQPTQEHQQQTIAGIGTNASIPVLSPSKKESSAVTEQQQSPSVGTAASPAAAAAAVAAVNAPKREHALVSGHSRNSTGLDPAAMKEECKPKPKKVKICLKIEGSAPHIKVEILAAALAAATHSSSSRSSSDEDSGCTSLDSKPDPCNSSKDSQKQKQESKALSRPVPTADPSSSSRSSSSKCGQEDFRDYYIKIGVLNPESNPRMHLNLSTVLAGLKLNGRVRKKVKKGQSGPLHALRKICRGLRAALGPGAEQAWRNLGMKHKDKRGDINLAGCYAFLESILGADSCPYVCEEGTPAATWIKDRVPQDSASKDSQQQQQQQTHTCDTDYLWPQGEELNEPGVVCYIARLISWFHGKPLEPRAVNGCYLSGCNGYTTDDNKLGMLGVYCWNWPLPLMHAEVKLSQREPARERLPPNRAPRTIQKAAAAAAGAGVGGAKSKAKKQAAAAASSKGGKGKKAGRKRKAATARDLSDDDDDDYEDYYCSYRAPAATTARGRALQSKRQK